MAIEKRKLTYRDLNQEEKSFWKEAYLAAMGALIAACDAGEEDAPGVGCAAEAQAWEAVLRMRGGA